MPIIDVELVEGDGSDVRRVTAQALADALGAIFDSPPGRTWVRLHRLEAGCYAENECVVAARDLPVFVTILHARPPESAARAKEVATVTEAVARCVGCDVGSVHVLFAPPGVGRQAFGGRLVE